MSTAVESFGISTVELEGIDAARLADLHESKVILLGADNLYTDGAARSEDCVSAMIRKIGIDGESWTEATAENSENGVLVELVAKVACSGVACKLINEVEFNRHGRAIRERLFISVDPTREDPI
jgi:hypothetical protein